MQRKKIFIMSAETVKNDKGQSNITYTEIKQIHGNMYPIKQNLYWIPTEIGIDDRAHFVLITKDQTVTSSNYIKVDGILYGIDQIWNYTHTEIFLREL